MYSKLPLKFIGVTDDFGMRQDPISGVSTYHYGVDLGWNKYQGEPVYAAHDGQIVYEGYDSNLGNYVVLKYTDGKNTIINRYLHLKNRALVKQNQQVSRGEILGYMGATGYVTAVHLHFEYWVCPSSYSYKYQDRSKYAKNPLDYCFLFEDQEVSSGSTSKVKKVVGSPTSRNQNKSQIRVTGKYLNCRTSPSLKADVLGYIDFGYYNILDTKTSDGYTWYKIASNKWVAYLSSIVTRYLVETESDSTTSEETEDNNETTIEETTNTDQITDESSSNSESSSDNLPNKDDNILENYNSFTSPKADYYYIYLEEGEQVYYPK